MSEESGAVTVVPPHDNDGWTIRDTRGGKTPGKPWNIHTHGDLAAAGVMAGFKPEDVVWPPGALDAFNKDLRRVSRPSNRKPNRPFRTGHGRQAPISQRQSEATWEHAADRLLVVATEPAPTVVRSFRRPRPGPPSLLPVPPGTRD